MATEVHQPLAVGAHRAISLLQGCLVGVVLVLSGNVQAEEPADWAHDGLAIQPPGAVLVTQGETVLTTSGLDAHLSRIDEADRSQFLFSRSRLSEAIRNLMLPRLVVDHAKGEGFLKDPLLQAKLYQSALVLISQEYFQHHARENRLDDYSAQARELYLTEPENFRTPERVDFTHVLISAGADRSELQAMELVQALYERLGEGVSLESLAEAFSDDPSVEDNGGMFTGVSVGEIDERIVNALELLDPEQISEPLRSDRGWHIVQLNNRHEREVMNWEQAEPLARERAERRHLERAHQRLVDSLKEPELKLHPGILAEYLEQYGIEWRDFANGDESAEGLLDAASAD